LVLEGNARLQMDGYYHFPEWAVHATPWSVLEQGNCNSSNLPKPASYQNGLSDGNFDG
jgi:hypothetical protein